jgi:hypothetical protein
MNPKRAFYSLWILQLLSNLVILAMATINLVIIFNGHPEGIIIALIFARIIYIGENGGTGFKALIKDYKTFKEDQYIFNINKRYSLKNKREIPKKIIIKQLKRKDS